MNEGSLFVLFVTFKILKPFCPHCALGIVGKFSMSMGALRWFVSV
jgi:hypothetical protein